MRDILIRVFFAIVSAVVTWALSIGADKMPTIASSFLSTFWPLLVGGAVFLIVWQIQFFRNFKRTKNAEIRAWLEDQDRKLPKEYERRFNDMYRETKDAWETARDVVERCPGTFERRVSQLEGEIAQMKATHHRLGSGERTG